MFRWIERLQTVACRPTWLVVHHLARTEFNKWWIWSDVLHRYLHLWMERFHIKICVSSFFGKTGSTGNTGLPSLMAAVSQSRGATALFFLSSLSHKVSMVPYSSLSIICLACLGIWFNWTGALWNKYPVISFIFNYWTQRCSTESVNGFSSRSSPVDDFHMCTTLSRVPSGLF